MGVCLNIVGYGNYWGTMQNNQPDTNKTPEEIIEDVKKEGVDAFIAFAQGVAAEIETQAKEERIKKQDAERAVGKVDKATLAQEDAARRHLGF